MKVSNLDPQNQQLQGNDILPVVNTSEGATKKVEISQIVSFVNSNIVTNFASGQQGAIQYSDGSGGFDHTDNVVYDVANSRLGIFKQSPQKSLHVGADTQIDAASIILNNSLGNPYVIFDGNQKSIEFAPVNGTQQNVSFVNFTDETGIVNLGINLQNPGSVILQKDQIDFTNKSGNNLGRFSVSGFELNRAQQTSYIFNQQNDTGGQVFAFSQATTQLFNQNLVYLESQKTAKLYSPQNLSGGFVVAKNSNQSNIFAVEKGNGNNAFRATDNHIYMHGIEYTLSQTSLSLFQGVYDFNATNKTATFYNPTSSAGLAIKKNPSQTNIFVAEDDNGFQILKIDNTTAQIHSGDITFDNTNKTSTFYLNQGSKDAALIVEKNSTYNKIASLKESNGNEVFGADPNGIIVNSSATPSFQVSGKTIGFNIDAANAKSRIDISNSSVGFAQRTVTSSTTLDVSDYTVFSDTGSAQNDLIQTLPDPTTVTRRVYIVKNIGGNTTTIDTTSGTIEGVNSIDVDGNGSVVTLQSDGNEWKLIGAYLPGNAI